MKLTILKCPNCAGKVKTENLQTAHCVHCGYDFVLEKEGAVHHHHYSTPSRNTSTTQRTGNIDPKRRNGIIMVYLILMILIIASFAIPAIFRNNTRHSDSKTSSVTLREVPISKHIVSFLETIMNKPMDKITSEDIAKIRYLDIDTDIETPIYDSLMDDIIAVHYSYENYEDYDSYDDPEFMSTVHTMYMKEAEDIDIKDLEVFTGLTSLSHGGGFSGREYSVSGMKDLSRYSNNLSVPFDVLGFADRSKIKYFSMGSYRDGTISEILTLENLQELDILSISDNNEDFALLSQLKSLKKLKVYSYSLENFQWLTTLENLESLHLTHVGGGDSVVTLYGLSKLKELTIGGTSELKTIDFVKHMPYLNRLVVDSYEIITIDPVAELTNLEYFSFFSNSSDVDIKAIGNLVNLKELHIQRRGQIPDISRLTKLEKVTMPLGMLDNLNPSLPLVYMNVYSGNSPDYDASYYMDIISGYKDLEELYVEYDVNDMRKTTMDFSVLKDLENLHTLEIHTAALKGIDQLTNINNLVLRELNIPVDMIMNPNNQIKSLEVYECRFIEYTERSYDIYNLGERPKDLTSIVGSMPQLEHLVLPSAKISSLEFVGSIPKLKYLNITDNYITDISELATRKELEEVVAIYNNIINNDVIANDVILMV